MRSTHFRPHAKALALCTLLGFALPASADTDYNGDGLCDVWQQRFNAWSLPPGADSDNDGQTNFQESQAGTNPRDPEDNLRIAESALAESDIVVKLASAPGKKYQLLSSSAPNGPTWLNVGAAVTGTGAQLTFHAPRTPAADRQFYKVEISDVDTDGDGVNDWAEAITGTDPTLSSSPSNASGGTATDSDTLASLYSLSATTVAAQGEASEKEGTQARLRLTRAADKSAIRLTLPFVTPSNPSITGGTASTSDYTLAVNQAGGQISGSTAGNIVLPAGASSMDIVVTPVPDSTVEVPELLTVSITRPGTGPASAPLSAAALIQDASPADENNRTLFVAYLGKEAGVTTTATGIATALVEGNNDEALISLNFSNLTSPQNTAYLRVDGDLEIVNIGLGQVAGRSWPIRAAQTKLTDQAMLNALHAGQLYISITTTENPTGEIRGYFNKATGSTTFTYNPALHNAPSYGSPEWAVLNGDAIERDIYRFLEQTTYGATAELYAEVRAEVNLALGGGQTYLKGLENWLDKQIAAPNPSLTTLTMAADNEEFVLRGNKPLWSGNDPQFGEVSYTVSYDSFGNPIPPTGTSSGSTYNNNHPFHNNRRREQWTLALQAKAQFRQRMAQALSEILVISEMDSTVQSKHYGAASYWDMLADGAFGKYRDLLEKVTYHPMMGIYLSHLRNRATYVSGTVTISPDENYAREIMQLFSIGLVLRHPDGSLVLGPDGLPIPTYDNNDITELARVLTGFCHGARHLGVSVQRFNGLYMTTQTNQRVSPTIEIQGGAGAAAGNGSTFTNFGEGGGDSWWQAPWMYPMKVLGKVGSTTYHDFGGKILLNGKHGQTAVPAQNGAAAAEAASHTMAETDVRLAHNCLAGDPTASAYGGHQNTPINISRWLIQRLTSSNPSAGYLYRVSERYRQTNGNLGAVAKAILLDYEARSLQLANEGAGNGRMKEPLVHFAGVVRALKGYTGIPLATLKDVNIPFNSTDSPMSTPYPQGEADKFVANASRFRFPDTTGNIGQSPLRAPSVFNWFLPDFTVPGDMAEAGLFAPEMQLATETTIVARVNRLWTFTWMNLVGMNVFAGVDLEDPVQMVTTGGPQVKVSSTQPPATAAESTFFDNRTFVFTPDNWSTPQTVTVAAVDDNAIEGTHTTRVHHTVTSTDAAYSGIGVPAVNVTISDNEAGGNARVIVTESGSDTMVAEGGATDTYTLTLGQSPASPVTVNILTTVNNLGTTPAEVTVSPASVTFNSSNWSTPQTITITAADDTANEGPEIVQVGHSVITADATFRQTNAPLVNVIVADNESNGSNALSLLQTQNGTLTLEGGASDSYFVTLRRAPNPTTSNVTVAINKGSDLTSSPASLTFTNANWNIPQKVTLTAVDDSLAEGTETFTVSNVASGASYSNVTSNVSVTIQDNDGGSVILAETGGGTAVTEASSTNNNPATASIDTYTLRLGSQPAAGTTVSVRVMPERHPRPMGNWAKLAGYYANDNSGSNLQKDRLIFDYSEFIGIYNTAYAAAGGNTNATNSHFVATIAVVDKMDLYLCGGILKARWPDLSLADLNNAAVNNPRKSIINGVYRGYSVTRLSTDTTNFPTEVRDRCRIAAYLISISPQSFVAR